jgi:type IV secretory pathway VirJ component
MTMQRTIHHSVLGLSRWGHAGRCRFLLLAALLSASWSRPSPALETNPPLRSSGPLASADLGALPIVEVPAPGGGDTLAFVASGDGGWAGLDRNVARALVRRGVPVVGLSSPKFYWHPHPPDDSARVLERILRHYLTRWQRERVLLIGYSRGADVLPFMASRLPEDLKQRVRLITLIGPEPRISFEFHLTDWLGKSGGDSAVVPEIGKLRGQKVLCVYGAKESDSVCPLLPAGSAVLDRHPGGHHFGGDYAAIARRIISEAGL